MDRVPRNLSHWSQTLTFAFIALLSAAATAPSHAREVTVTNQVPIPAGVRWRPSFWLGNVDDPVPPDDYRPNDPHRLHRWYFRNPFHNFDFYVIGVADKTFHRAGRYPDRIFHPRQGWNWTVCKYKWWRLPMISYIHEPVKFYFGWRERGDFGIEFKCPLKYSRPCPSPNAPKALLSPRQVSSR